MLKSHPADEPETLSGETLSTASQTRVTPEELSQALTAIEARRQAEASRLAGTIPISQVVSELNLDSTPEEILTEVQVQRARADQAKAAQEAEAKTPSVARQVVQTGYTAFQQAAAQRRQARPRRKGLAGVGIAGLVLFVTFGPLFHHTRHAPAVSHEMQALSLVSDNTPVFGDLATVQQIASGTPPTLIRVHRGDDLDNSWRLIKHDGQVYVQAYTLPVTEQAIKAGGKPFRLYNDDNAGQLKGEHYTDITLPLKSLHWDDSRSTDEGWGEITVSQVHPDSRIWENW